MTAPQDRSARNYSAMRPIKNMKQRTYPGVNSSANVTHQHRTEIVDNLDKPIHTAPEVSSMNEISMTTIRDQSVHATDIPYYPYPTNPYLSTHQPPSNLMG